MNSWTYITIFVAAWTCNMLVITATQCEDICDYTADDVQDATCHNRNLDHLPPGCEEARTLQAGRNNFVALDRTTFESFTQLEYLYMAYGVIETISPGALDPFADTINVISLAANSIRQLENHTFARMPLLGQLDLQKNRIESLQPGTFQNLPNLTILWLSHNRLRELPLSVFDGMPQLRYLHLQGNGLQRINSRLFLHLQSLKDLNLYSNEITTLTGNPLRSRGGSLQVEKLDLSQNNLTHFDCNWIGMLTAKVNLSTNLLESISNCRLTVEKLTLVNNPFHCGCESEEISEIYKARLDLIPPTCSEPPNERNKNITAVLYDECHNADVYSTARPKSKTLTTKLLEKLQTTTEPPQTALRTSRPDTSTGRNGLPTTSIVLSMGRQTSFGSYFTGEYQIYTILIIVVTGIICILLILFLSYRLTKKNHAKPGVNQNFGTTAVQSSPPSSRQGTGQGSHLYATIPGDDDTIPKIVDRNSNNVPPSGRVRSASENDRNCSCNCSHRSLQQRNTMSDSQDSGLADQGRNSLHEWLQAHMENGMLSTDGSFCDCDECYYLSVKDRDSWATCSSFASQQQQQRTSEVISMSEQLPSEHHVVSGGSSMHVVGRTPPVHSGHVWGPTHEVGRAPPSHTVGRSPPNTSSPQRHHWHPSTSHGGPIKELQRCNSCHKFRPVDHGKRTSQNQLEPGRRKTRKRDSSGYVPHNLIK